MKLIKTDENITMTSRDISKLTGKNHADVMRDIRNESKKLGKKIAQSIFALCSYRDENTRKRDQYTLTKDGVMQIGARYDAKIRYQLIQKLKELEAGQPKLSLAETYRRMADQIEENETLKSRGNLMMLQREDSSFRHIKVVLADNRALEEELVDAQKELGILNKYYTVTRVQKEFKRTFKWQELKSRSIALGYDIKKVPCPRYGEANAYHSDVWGDVYGMDL
ncbi:MAG: Rha family transcriptional regulator [Psychrilyobacter sp.]|uniref:Rha family transcriptional regulator n=1 Tax=Psychrilyobacter sp. TaxID=2586924 RepID=UPI003C713042